MSTKRKPGPAGPERIAKERQLAADLGLVIPTDLLGLPPLPTANLTQMRIAPPTEPAPGTAHRVLPPRGPRRARAGRLAAPAVLSATIEEQLRRIELGDRNLVPILVEQYGELAAQADSTPEFGALRRRVFSAALAGDVGEEPQADHGVGPQSRRIA